MKTIIFLLIGVCVFFTSAFSQTDEIEKLLNRYNEFEMINGVVLVADGDKLIYENAFGKEDIEHNVPNKIDTKFEVASLSKQFTAIMVLQLIDKGLLSLNTKIADILRDYPKGYGNKITIGQLLNHTSGLIDTRHIKNFDKTLGIQNISRKELVAVFKDSLLLFEPGTKWSYSNFGYNLLAIILETVSKKNISELLADKIFKPCGMANSATLDSKKTISRIAIGYEQDYYSTITHGQYHDPSWSVGSGNIITTAGDWFKYYQAYNKGKLLSEKMMKQLIKPETVIDYDSGDKMEIQFCFMQDKLVSPKDTVVFPYASGSHYGVHTAAYHFYKDKKLVVIFINLKILPMKMFEIGDNIAKILYHFPYNLPKDIYLRMFARDIKEKGIKEAIVQYKKRRSEQKDALTQSPRDFNRHGYYYLRNDKPEIAIEIFKLNLEIFPTNPDLFDSLGEGYMATGNNSMAIENFQKSIDLDPKNDHAREMLKLLKEKNK